MIAPIIAAGGDMTEGRWRARWARWCKGFSWRAYVAHTHEQAQTDREDLNAARLAAVEKEIEAQLARLPPALRRKGGR